MDTEGRNPEGRDSESSDTETRDTDPRPTGEGANRETVAEEGAPPLPDDPRVPRPEDADPTRSKELGGAAPAVGPGTP